MWNYSNTELKINIKEKLRVVDENKKIARTS